MLIANDAASKTLLEKCLGLRFAAGKDQNRGKIDRGLMVGRVKRIGALEHCYGLVVLAGIEVALGGYEIVLLAAVVQSQGIRGELDRVSRTAGRKVEGREEGFSPHVIGKIAHLVLELAHHEFEEFLFILRGKGLVAEHGYRGLAGLLAEFGRAERMQPNAAPEFLDDRVHPAGRFMGLIGL